MPLEMISLAAGLGSRFGGDKQVTELGPGGELLLELNAYDGIQAGVDSLAWITRTALVPFLEERAARVRATAPVRVEVQSQLLDPRDPESPRREKPWGTAHAWLAAARANQPAMVLNADDVYGAEAVRAVAGAMRQPAAHGSGPRPTAWIGGYRAADTLSRFGGVSRARLQTQVAHEGSDDANTPDGEDQYLRVGGLTELRGVRRTEAGHIEGVDPAGDSVLLEDHALVSMNLWGFSGDWLPLLLKSRKRFREGLHNDPDAEFGIPDVVFNAVSEGSAQAFVVPVRSQWIGVTFPGDRPHAEAALLEEFRSGAYPSPLFPPQPDPTNLCN